MKKQLFYIGMFLFLSVTLLAQEERKYIRDGYKAYMNGDYSNAEVDFKKAEDANEDSYVARYNTSTAIYEQERLEESGKRFSELLSETDDLSEKAKLLHNLGNVHLKDKKYQEAVDAYKKSLRINPADEDTRYNLAYALEKLREQQQQEQQQNKDQKQDQEKQDNKDQQQEQEQNQEDQENQDNQQQEQDQEGQEKQDQQQQQDQDQAEEQQAQPQKMELSKEDAERLLQAILQREKDVKEKVDKKKLTGKKIKTDKDW